MTENRGTALSPIALFTVCMVLVSVVALFAHWPVLSANALSFDDEEAITQNHLIQSPGWRSVGRFFGEVRLSSVVPGYYRPLTLTSLMLDWAMGGRPDNFFPFHRTSLALHVLSTLLVSLLIYQLFHRPIIAAMVGVLFGVHPLTVEPIAWVMERKTLLAAMFSFASLCAYVRYTCGHRRRWFVVSLLLFFVSLLAKPTGMPLPIMLLLMDYWPLRRLSRRALFEKVPFLILAGVFAVLACACENTVNPLSVPAKLSPLHLPLRLCYLVVFYLAKIVLPVHLSSVYLLPEPLSPGNPSVLLALGGVVILCVVLMVSSRWTPALWVGTSILFVGLAPTMGFVGYSWVVASDKYVYLPFVGVLLIVAALLETIWSRETEHASARRAATLVTVVAAAGCLTAATRGYLNEWQSTDRLVRHMLDLAPQSPELRNLSASQKLHGGQFREAIAEFTRAIELQPSNADAYANRSIAHGALGEYEQAIRDSDQAIELRPRFAEAFNSRGAAYGGMRDFDQELRDCSKAIDLKPTFVNAYNNRSLAHRRKGNFEQAARDSTTAIDLMWNQPLAYRDRGVAYFTLARLDEAIRDFTTVLGFQPENAPALRNRGSAYAKSGQYQLAVKDFTAAITLAPGEAGLYQDRAAAYYALKEYDAAWADLNVCQQRGGSPNPELLAKLTEARSGAH